MILNPLCCCRCVPPPQRLPKDGLKKLVLTMERQKLVYEEKALVALQKATLEKTEALVESHRFQVRKHLAFTQQAAALRPNGSNINENYVLNGKC